MRLTKPKPPNHVWVLITRQQDTSEKFSVYECELDEYQEHCKRALINHVDPFANGKQTTVAIRRNGMGTTRSLSFKGISPKEVREIITQNISK